MLVLNVLYELSFLVWVNSKLGVIFRFLGRLTTVVSLRQRSSRDTKVVSKLSIAKLFS